MSYLGPYVIFSGDKPIEWLCLSLDSNGIGVCYKAPYVENNSQVTWKESRLNEKDLLYVYEPDTGDTGVSACYFAEKNQLNRVPIMQLQGEQRVSRVDGPIFEKNGIRWNVVPKRAGNYQVNIQQYPHPNETLVQSIKTTIPTLPYAFQSPVVPQDAEAPVLKNTTPLRDADYAKHLLQVKQCVIVTDAADCPEQIQNGSMYLWQDKGEWNYKTNFLNTVKTGALSAELDKTVIAVLNKSAAGDVTFKIQGNLLMSLSRPYLKLNPAQQAEVISVISDLWPLTADVSEPDQLRVCLAVLRRVALASNQQKTRIVLLEQYQKKRDEMPTPLPELEQQIAQLKAAIAKEEQLVTDTNAFRSCLFPSVLDRMLKNNFKDNTTIADVINFIEHLTLGVARDLDYIEPLSLQPASSDSNVQFGQYKHEDGSFQLIYQGLQANESELFRLILNYETMELEEFREESLDELKKALAGIMDPSHPPEFREVTYDLLPAVSASRGISQEEAKIIIEKECKAIIRKIEKISVNRTLQREIKALIALLSSDDAFIKLKVLDALSNLSSNPEIQKIMIEQKRIEALIALLSSGDVNTTLWVLDALLKLSSNPEIQKIMIEQKGIEALIALVSFGDFDTKQSALYVLLKLSSNPDCQKIIIEQNGIEAFIVLLSSGDVNTTLWALDALSNLSLNPEVQKIIIEQKGIEALISLVSSGDAFTKQSALDALSKLSSIPEVQKIIIEHKGIEALIALVSFGNFDTKQSALDALSKLSSNPEVQKIIIEQEGIEALIALVSSGDVRTKKYAIELLSRIAQESFPNAFGEIEALISLLNSPNHLLKEHTVKALTQNAHLNQYVMNLLLQTPSMINHVYQLVDLLKIISTDKHQSFMTNFCNQHPLLTDELKNELNKLVKEDPSSSALRDDVRMAYFDYLSHHQKDFLHVNDKLSDYVTTLKGELNKTTKPSTFNSLISKSFGMDKSSKLKAAQWLQSVLSGERLYVEKDHQTHKTLLRNINNSRLGGIANLPSVKAMLKTLHSLSVANAVLKTQAVKRHLHEGQESREKTSNQTRNPNSSGGSLH